MTLFDTNPSNSCLAYQNLRAEANDVMRAGREHCEDLWRDFEEFSDTNFLSHFPLHTHQRWFEMYLTVALMRSGLAVQCPKPGPDIGLKINGRQIWIEATCASAGEEGKPDSVPKDISQPDVVADVVTDRPTDQMTLRIRNSLDVKQRKFQEWIADGIVGPGDLTVIAINVHDIPMAWPDMNDLMRRALYGLGNEVLTSNGDIIVRRSHESRPEIKKSTGSAVCMRPFVDGSLAHISAVLGSTEDVVNRSRCMGEGFILYPNVAATTAWLVGTISLGREWVSARDVDGNWKMTLNPHVRPDSVSPIS